MREKKISEESEDEILKFFIRKNFYFHSKQVADSKKKYFKTQSRVWTSKASKKLIFS